ncbi:hypothetical protein GCM10027578_17210 [Spirosoma luteolum]|jgi:hypothetical protein
MKKKVLPLMAVAMTLTFSACQPTDTVAPTVEAVKTNDDLTLGVLNSASGDKGGEIMPMPAYPSSAQIKAAFDTFDVDKSGQISATELALVLAKGGIRGSEFIAKIKLDKEMRNDIKADITPAAAAQIIKMFDANNSGMMEFNEFERLIEEALKQANKIK